MGAPSRAAASRRPGFPALHAGSYAGRRPDRSGRVYATTNTGTGSTPRVPAKSASGRVRDVVNDSFLSPDAMNESFTTSDHPETDHQSRRTTTHTTQPPPSTRLPHRTGGTGPAESPGNPGDHVSPPDRRRRLLRASRPAQATGRRDPPTLPEPWIDPDGGRPALCALGDRAAGAAADVHHPPAAAQAQQVVSAGPQFGRAGQVFGRVEQAI